MALSLITQNVCSKLLGDFDGNFDGMSTFKNTILSNSNIVQNTLNNLKNTGFSDVNDVINNASSVLNNYEDFIPSLSDLDDLARFIEACLYASESDILNTPLGLFRSITDYLYDNLYDVVGLLTDTTPEFSIAIDMSKLDRLLDSLRVPFLTDLMGKILNCLDEICGTDITSRQEELSTFLSDCKLTSGGALDVNTIYDNCGLTDGQKEIMGIAKGSVYDAVSTLDTSVLSCVDRLKII